MSTAGLRKRKSHVFLHFIIGSPPSARLILKERGKIQSVLSVQNASNKLIANVLFPLNRFDQASSKKRSGLLIVIEQNQSYLVLRPKGFVMIHRRHSSYLRDDPPRDWRLLALHCKSFIPDEEDSQEFRQAHTIPDLYLTCLTAYLQRFPSERIDQQFQPCQVALQNFVL